jgi:phosphoglycolate phosphatase
MRAVIFDLDGTLIDSLSDIGGSLNHVLAEMGLPVHPIEAYEEMVGEGAAELVRKALPSEKRAALHAEVLERYRARYRTHLVVDSRPYEGIEDLLAELERRGMPKAVLTNKPHAPAIAIVQQLLGRFRWDAILGQRDGVPHKPDPTGAHEIAERLGVARRDCALVGDSRIDVETARHAGMLPIGCLWGFRDREELVRAGAVHVVAHPREILGLL